jgi:hypothetical protein
MSIRCPLCAEQLFEDARSYFKHLSLVHPTDAADPVKLAPLLVPAVVYVKGASFSDTATARAVYRFIADFVLDKSSKYDMGVALASYNGLQVVVVDSLEIPPELARDMVETYLGLMGGTPWPVPRELIQALIMRRMRQIVQGVGQLRPNGLRHYEQSSIFKRIDVLGREV